MKIIEICIGIVFIYLLLSLIATILMEIIASLIALRGQMLKTSLKKILDAQKPQKEENEIISDTFLGSPLFKQLIMVEKKLPSYISSNRFLDIVFQHLLQEGDDLDIATLKKRIKDFPEGEFKNTLLFYLTKSQGSLAQFNAAMTEWYDETMDRVSGWYKRRTQLILFIIGLCIAISFNANTIKVYEVLNEDDKVREDIVNMAAQTIKNNKISFEDTSKKSIALYRAELDTLQQYYAPAANQLGLGWKCDCPSKFSWQPDSSIKKQNKDSIQLKHNYYNALFSCPTKANEKVWTAPHVLYTLVGWLLTALAISLGAPFWFDLLKLFINIRNAGKALNSEKVQSSPSPVVENATILDDNHIIVKKPI